MLNTSFDSIFNIAVNGLPGAANEREANELVRVRFVGPSAKGERTSFPRESGSFGSRSCVAFYSRISTRSSSNRSLPAKGPDSANAF